MNRKSNEYKTLKFNPNDISFVSSKLGSVRDRYERPGLKEVYLNIQDLQSLPPSIIYTNVSRNVSIWEKG